MRIHSPHLSQSSSLFLFSFLLLLILLFFFRLTEATSLLPLLLLRLFILVIKEINHKVMCFYFILTLFTFYYNGRSDLTQTGLKRSESSADRGRGGEEHFFLDRAKENVFLFLLLLVFLYRISILA